MNEQWFGRVGRTVALDESLTTSAKAVYLVLAVHVDIHSLECHIATGRIGQAVGLSRRQVIRVLDQLIAAGYVEKASRFRDGAQTSNLYRLTSRGGVTPVARGV